jgi:hypothetical protein
VVRYCGLKTPASRRKQKIILYLIVSTLLPFINPFVRATYTTWRTTAGETVPIRRSYKHRAGVVLVGPFGVSGVALGTLLPMLVITPIILRQCCRCLDISILDYVRATVSPSLLPVFIMAVVVGLYRYQTQLDSYTELLLAVALGAVSYIPVFFVTGLQPNERRWIIDVVRIRVTGKPVFRQ